VGLAVLTAPEQPGVICPTGGVRFVVGADANRNGALDDAEINSMLTRSVCNGPQGVKGADGTNGTNGAPGTNGVDGLSTLVATSTEPAGGNCVAGGSRMDAGRDANRNGTLDEAEVDASLTRYVCNGLQGFKGDTGAKGDTGDTGAKGADGASGANGVDGLSTLVLTSAEPAGANCEAGGTRMEGGRDANRNGMLDAGELEVSLTRYVCDGLRGLKGEPGAKGDPGVKGDKGDTGDIGPMGPPGESGAAYARTKVVSPGATDVDSGNALRAAIDGITDGKTWLVQVEPGVYDLGSTALTLKPGIHLRGSGENTTLLRSAVDSSASGTVVGVSGSVLSALSVENIGGGSESIALYSAEPGFNFHDLTATAQRGSDLSFAISLRNAKGTFENVRVIASGYYSIGFFCVGCTASLTESHAEARGTSRSRGVYVGGGTVSLRNVTVNASGGGYNWGVYADGDVSLVNVEASGSGGFESVGLYVGDGNGTARNSVLSATGASTNEGITSHSDFDPRLLTVQNSVVTGSSASVRRGSYFTVRLGQSQLFGPVTQADTSTGKYACIGNYDGDFAPADCL
jgi:hypothetical protein